MYGIRFKMFNTIVRVKAKWAAIFLLKIVFTKMSFPSKMTKNIMFFFFYFVSHIFVEKAFKDP